MQKFRFHRNNNEAILDLIKKLVSLIIAKEKKILIKRSFSKECNEILRSNFLKHNKKDILYLIKKIEDTTYIKFQK